MKRKWIAWGVLLAACGGREAQWEAPIEGTVSYGLDGSVALRDDGLNRLLMLTSPEPYQLQVTPVPVGKNIAAIQPSADKKKLFILSKGEHPRFRPEDERPRLMVIDGGTNPALEQEFSLDDPLLKLAVDPRGEWIAAYQSDSTVMNPNELVLFSLAGGDTEARTRTIRSFGGAPVELLFTDPLTVPSGAVHRFLVVRTDRDITLLDLTDLSRSEITVPLPQLQEEGRPAEPAQVVFDDGDPNDPSDAHLAIRLAGESDIVLVSFVSQPGGQRYSVQPNIVDAGGVPSAIDFVRTDDGQLRLAALVPSRRRATLIDPGGTSVETVEFPVAYSRMTRITDSISSTLGDDDVALLWSPDVRGIAFWSLGQTSSTPYRSVDPTDIDLAVQSVIDVPAPNRHIKLLSGSGADRFFVLDLERRQTFPMLTRGSGFRVNVAPDGGRLWAYQRGQGHFSGIDLADLHPTSLSARLRISEVHDIERADGSRAALVLHGSESSQSAGSVSATLFDALAPDAADTRFFGGFYSEGL